MSPAWGSVCAPVKCSTCRSKVRRCIAIYANKDKIRTTSEPSVRGIVVTQTSSDPKVIALLQEHAVEVSELVRGGMAAMHTAMMKNHGMMGGTTARPYDGWHAWPHASRHEARGALSGTTSASAARHVPGRFFSV